MSSNKTGVSRGEIGLAHERIADYVRRTPLLEAASPILGAPPISLKLEFLQHTGSFKPRGAFNNLLTRKIPPAGCAAASGGNHGAAVAYAARKLGVKARIFVPEIAAPVKIAKIRAYGAEVHVEGATYFDALALCDAYVANTGALAIHAYESPATVAGQGTVAMEWEEDLARLDLRPARHGARRGRRRRVDRGRRNLVRRSRESHRRRARRFARPRRRASKRAIPSMFPSSRSRRIRWARGASASSIIDLPAEHRRRLRSFPTRRSARRSLRFGRTFRSSPNPAARRPMRRWRAAPMSRRPAKGSASSFAAPMRISPSSRRKAAPRVLRSAASPTMVRPLRERRPRPSRPVGA